MSTNTPAKRMGGNGNQCVNKVDLYTPLQIFPEEIWLKIFGLFTEPEDLENVFFTCPLFQKFLDSEKLSFLLPKVLKIIDSKYPFSCNDILRFRQVSHFWKYTVETTIQNRKSKYNFLYETDEYLNVPEELLNTFQDSTALSTQKRGAEHLDRLWTGLAKEFYGPRSSLEPKVQRKYEWSPVPSRHIIICDKHIPNPPENPENMGMGNYRHPTFALLVRLGVIDVIWYMDIWIRYSAKPKLWCSFIKNWVRDAPDVKVLQFNFPYQGTESELNEVEEEARRYPFQLMKNLIMLTLDSVPRSVSESILAANKHVEMLQILRSNPGIPFDLNIELLNSLVNMRKFSLSFHTDSEFELFEQITWPNLAILYLNLEQLTISWNRVFLVLHKFGNLCDLTIKMPKDKKATTNDSTNSLSMPCLKWLKLSINEHNSLDFLVGLALEDLYIIVNLVDYKENVNQQIQLYGYFTSLENSNIWNKMPTLKRVRIAIKNESVPEYCRYIYKRTKDGIVKC